MHLSTHYTSVLYNSKHTILHYSSLIVRVLIVCGRIPSIVGVVEHTKSQKLLHEE